ncbi:MAG: hypothetical protein NTW74_05780 [Acidobacteria bacterium]|nr:hypothetical protein [Acidobacteriota bacterium]
MFLLLPILLLTIPLHAQDAANITNPSQADMLVGTRVPRGMTWSTPTTEERLRVLWRGLALSPGAYIRSTFTAASHHLDNKPKDFGQGWGAYAKRNLNSFVTYSLQDVASEGLAAASGYEMRYIQCKCTRVLPRIRHALWFNLVTYNREGKTVVNWPNIVGSYSIGMLSTTYTPNQKWSAQGIQMGNSAMAFGFVSSLLQEFTPSRLLRLRKKRSSKETALSSPVEASN